MAYILSYKKSINAVSKQNVLVAGLFFLLAFFVLPATLSAATKTWTGATNNDWNTAGNWSPAGVPLAADIANIPGSLTNYPVINNTVSITTVNINSAGSGASVTVTTGGSFTVSGLLTVNANGTFAIDAGTATLAGLTASGVISVSGGTITSTANITLNTGGALNQSGGLIHLAANTATTPTDHVTIASGATINQSGGTLYTKDYITSPGTFNQTGSSAIFKLFRNWKPGAGSIFNSTAGTVQFSGAASAGDFSTGTKQFSNIVVDAGINPDFSNVAASTINISGNFTNNNSTLLAQASLTVTFNGSGAQNFYTAAPANTIATSLVINNTGTVTFTSAIQVGTLIINGGALTTSASNYAFTVTGSATLNAGSFNLNNSAVSVTGDFTNGGTDVTGGTSALTISGNYISNDGTYNAPSSTIIVGGNWTNNNALTFSAGSVTFTGSAKTIGGTTATTFPSIIITTGTITLNNNSTCTALTFTNNAVANSFTLGAAVSFTVNGSVTINQATANVVHALNINTSSATITGNLIFNVTANNAGRSTKVSITTGSITVNGNITMTNTLLAANSQIDMSGGAGTFYLGGNFNVTSLGTLTPGTTSTFVYNGTGSQNVETGSAVSYNNLTINKPSGTATLNGSKTIVNLNLLQGTFNASGLTMTISGNVLNNGGILTGSPATTFTGIAKTISGTGTTDFGAVTFNNGTTYTLSNTNTCTGLSFVAGGLNTSLTQTSTGNLTVNGGVTINQPTSNTITIAWNINAGTATVTGNINIGGVGTTTTRISRITITTGTLNANGNIVYNSSSTTPGTAVINMTGGAGILNLQGSLILTNTTGTLSPGTSSTVNFNGTSAQTVSFASAISYFNINTNNAAGVTISAAVASTLVTGNITVQTGFLSNGGFAIAMATSKTFQVLNGATFKVMGTSGMVTGTTITKTFGATSTVEYGGTTQTVSNELYGHLTLTSSTGAAVKTMPNTAMTIAGNLTSSLATGTSVSFTALANYTIGGNVSLGASTTFDGGSFTHSVAGNWVNNGTYTASTSSVTLTGSSTTISSSGTHSFYNLTVTGANITSAVANLAVTNNLLSTGAGSFTHTGVFTMSGTGKTISGSGFTFNDLTLSGTISTTSVLTVTGNMSAGGAGSFTSSAGSVTMSGTSKTITATGAINLYHLTVTGSVTTATNLNISSVLAVTGTLSASAGTTTFTASSSLSGTANLYNVTINGTSLQLTANSVLGIANTYTLSAGTLDVTTSTPNTVHFNGSAPKTIAGGTFHHLQFTGSTYTAGGNITVNGDVTINASATFAASSFTHYIKSNWINYGTFTAGTSTIEFNGVADGNITGATTFNNISINKSASTNTVNVNSNVSVGTISMTQGAVSTGTNTLTITVTRTGTGIIIGWINRVHSFTTGVAYEFEGPNNSVTFTAVSSVTSVLVKITKGAIADFPFGGSLNRLYDISIPAGTYTANLRLHYEDVELNGNAEASMALWSFNSSWAVAGRTSGNTTTNYVEQTGLTSISTRWTCSDDNNVISWNGSVSSNWSTAANWTSVQGVPSAVPSANDIVQIGVSTYTNAPTISTAATAKSITFGSAQASTLSLTTGGSLITQGNISGLWSSNATHTLNVNNQAITVNGDVVLSDGTSLHAINLNIGTGTITITGALTESGGANITFSGGGALNIGNNFNYISGTFTKSTSTVTYNGTVSQGVGAVNYHHLIINKTGIATVGSAASISGNLTVTAGELDFSAASVITGNVTIASGAIFNSGNVTHTVGGNWSNSGTFNPASGTITLNGTGTQNVSATPFNNLTVNKSAGTAILGNLTINGNISLLSGTLDLSTFTANRSTLGGSFSMSNGTTLYLAGAANFPSNYSVYTLGTTSTVEYNGSVAQAVAGITYGHLTFTNGTTNAKTLAGATTVNGNFTINSGATFGAGAYTLAIGGNWINSGTFISSTSTVNFSGSTKTITGNTTFNKLTITGSYTVAGSNITTNDLFYIPTGGSYAGGSGTFTLNGDLTNNGTFTSTGTTTYSGTAVQTVTNSGATMNLNILNFNGTISPVMASTSSPIIATVNINNTGGVTTNVDWTVTSAFNIAAGATFNGSNKTHTINGSFTNNGTVSSSGVLRFITSASQTIKLAGTSFSSTGTVEFGGSGAQSVTGSPNILTNVTLSNTTGVTPASNWTIAGNFAINSGGVFNAGTFSYSVGGNLQSSGTLNGGTSLFTMTSAAGTLSGSTTTTFYDFTISGTGVISAINDYNVSRNFTNNGSYDGTAAILKMTGTDASIIGGTATTYNLDQLTVQKTGAATATLARNLVAVSNLIITSGVLDASTYTITQVATNDGAFTISAGASFKIGGTNTLPVFLTYSLDTTSTVEYNGGAQSVSAATAYGNLVLSTTGNKTAAAALTVLNNFSLSTGTFIGGSFTHNIGGNWTMSSGTFTSTGTTINLNGIYSQTVTSTGSFNHLTVNKPSANAVLGGNITVSGTLTFTLGLITTGSYSLITTSGTVTGAAQSTGWINGNMQRNFATGTNVAGIFYVGCGNYYTPVTLTFASVTGSGGAITVAAFDGAHPNISGSTITADKNIPRYWRVTNTGGITFTSYTISLTWNTAQNYTPLTTSLLKVGKYTSSAWSLPTVTGTPTTSNVQANGITTFGDFICGQTCDVTAGFSYTGTPYCSNYGDAAITLNGGASAGAFTFTPTGLTINASSGLVTTGTSTAGSYTVTNTATGTGGCTTAANTTITISTAPSATISYTASPYCISGGTASVTRTGTSGGTYSSTAGLSISTTTGAITLGSSTAGSYTVTYTIAAGGGCSVYTTTAGITLNAAPSASISYAGSPYCSNAGSASVTFSGTTGGTYSSTAGLSINATTGAVNLGASTAGSYTVTYTVAASGGCSLYTTTTGITINAAPAATISYAGSPYCSSDVSASVTFSGTTGGTYSSTAGLSINATTGAVNITGSTAGSYTVTYTVAAANGCAQYQTTTSFIINLTGKWTGATSTNWNTAGNWLCGGVPTGSVNVVIPGSLTNYPSITSGTAAVQNITISSGASLTVSGAALQIAGTLSNSGTFTASNGLIELNGSSAQSIPASAFAGNVIKDFKVNNAAGVTLGGALGITGAVTITNGSLATGGYLTLKSTVTGTARIAPITSNASTPISGNVTVERYVPGRRKYRLITSSVTTSAAATLTSGQEALSIWGNWQNQGNTSTANVGNFITGGSTADGFDQQTANPSLFTYDDVNRQYVGFTSANGKNTKYTPLKAGVAYYMFVYGDRLNSITTSTPNATVLKSTGTLITGNQTYNSGSVQPLSNVTGRFTLVGNPFASPIDWTTLPTTNLANTYWGWDPNLSSTGGYVTVSNSGTATLIAPFSGTVGLNQYIQPGQGFFVKTTAASPVLTIREQDKVSNFNANAFRGSGSNNISLMAINLLYESGGANILADGVVAAFDPHFSNGIGKEDASKLNNNAEVLSIKNGSDLLSIDGREMPLDNDSISLQVSKLTKQQYTLQIFANKLDTLALQPYLHDAYLHTSIALSVFDTNRIVFNVTANDAASSATGRFSIVFKKLTGNLTTFTSLKAVQKEKDVQVDWSVNSDAGIVKYEIERSGNNITFIKAGETTAKGGTTPEAYHFIDVNTPAQNLWYRIRLLHTDGNFSYSKSVAVNVEEKKPVFNIYPNTITDNRINLYFNEIERGEYTLIVFGANGQQIIRQTIQHQGTVSTQTITLDRKPAPGIYYVRLVSGNVNYINRILVK